MNILALGDITNRVTLPYLREKLFRIREKLNVSFVVANGENVSDIKGITKNDAEALLDSGVDMITTGNHVWGKPDIFGMLDSSNKIIRPANFPAECPGQGFSYGVADGYRVLCMNVMGVTYMEPLASPFDTIDRILEAEKGNYDLSLLDIHAEATSEKLALAYYFDGRINIIFGTHTHVTTADEQILPHGSGYITDLGMSGPMDSVLGCDKNSIIERFKTKMPTKFLPADSAVKIHGALFELTDNHVVSVKRIAF